MLKTSTKLLPQLVRGGSTRFWAGKAASSRGVGLNVLRAMSSAPERIEPFLLADIGEGIAEVELMQWFVKEGEQVKAFDRLCEAEDKATAEITSRYDGTVVAVHHEEGSMFQSVAPCGISTSDRKYGGGTGKDCQ